MCCVLLITFTNLADDLAQLTKLYHININKKNDINAFGLQNIKKSGAVFLYFEIFYSLILADNIIIYLSFVLIYGNHLKYVALTANFLQ